MNTPRWPNKDPNEVLDYRIDWTHRLTVNRLLDIIETSEWSVDNDDVVVENSSFLGNYTTVWLSGGDLGQTYTVTNTITTQAGRTMVQSVQLKIAAR